MPSDQATPESQKPKKKTHGIFHWLRNSLLAGIAVLFPVGITLWIIKVIGYDLLDQPARTALAWAVGLFMPEDSKLPGDIEQKWIGVGIALTVIFLFVVGVLTRSFMGKQLLRLTEFILDKVPLVRSVYNGVKQLSDAVFTKAGTDSFRKAVLVKFMGEDAYAVGFVTGETKGEAQEVTPEKVINVFVPTTPNPTSGYLLMVPEDRLIPLQMTVEQAIKMVISGGMLTPPAPAEPMSGDSDQRTTGNNISESSS